MTVMHSGEVPAERAPAAETSEEQFARLVQVVDARSDDTALTEPIDEAGPTNLLCPTTFVGASDFCQLRLSCENAAPLAAIITLDAGTLRVRALPSGDVKLNGASAELGRLRDGDMLEFGPLKFRVETNLAKRKLGGFLLDRYQVRQILAAGGMCWVYLADDLQTGQRVALKVLPKKHKPRMRLRFEVEARVGLKVDHPRLVRTLLFDHNEDVYYLVMEFFEAISIQELASFAGKLPWPLACSFALQAAEGLAYLHENGIVHRDVKPANVLVDYQGAAKLIDFGLALVEGEELELSLAEVFGQQFIGTADYMPPEQMEDSGAVDGRADLFSLGATLYFALCGKTPFPAQTRRELIRSRSLQVARSLHDLAPGVPGPVIAVVERLLAKDPAARVQTAAELVAALQPFAEQRPVKFDFEAVLRARLANVRKRTDEIRLAREQAYGVSGAQSGSSAPSAASSSAGSAASSSANSAASNASELKSASATATKSSEPKAPTSDATAPNTTGVNAAEAKPVSTAALLAGDELSPELAALVAAWPDLPAHARRVIQALVKADAKTRDA